MRNGFYILAFIALIFLGCAEKAPQVEKKAMTSYNIIFEQDSIKDWLAIENAISFRRADGMTEIEIVGKNKSSSTKTFTYRIDWYDENGFTIKSILTKWKIVNVEGRKNVIIRAISPAENANDYKVRIGLQTPEDGLRDKNLNVREYQGE